MSSAHRYEETAVYALDAPMLLADSTLHCIAAEAVHAPLSQDKFERGHAVL